VADPLFFDRDFEPPYGVIEDVLPGVRRIVAKNPGPYTFKGSATFVLGRGEVAVIDPGPKDEAHIDAILAALVEHGETVSHVLVTHTHPDHSPGTALLKERTGAKSYGFGRHPVEPDTPEDAFEYPKKDNGNADPHDPEATSEEHRGDVDFVPDHAVTTGDVITGKGWRAEALHTPGHISNHLCFALPDLGLVFTGDHVMGWSTSVISPPGGDLSDYLASLQLLAGRRESIYVPTHGKPIPKGPEFANGLLAHRNARTDQVLDQLQAGETSVPKMVDALYIGLDERLVPAAGRSVLAHLLDLMRRGLVTADVKAGCRVGTGSSFRLA
jgi:glyoxylase-like metal-dependent hydrolase (beta-lactamase superfamily II)